MSEKPHSSEHFTGSRNLWWHDDYLDLLAQRLGLGRCRHVLDLGAGGLDAPAFERAWALVEEMGRREEAARADRSLSYCGPGSHFVFAARAPV